MEAMTQEWAEGRLDELSKKVDMGFERVDRRFEQVDAGLTGLRTEMKTEFTAIRTEMNGIQRTMIQMMVALTAAILAGFAGICTLIATQL
jgi:Skp family chaperone for outer membrane proteins